MNGDGHFFHFWLELPFLGKFGPKNQNCKFKRWNLIFRLIRICRIQHGVHFICFRLEIPFLDKFGPKNQNRKFKLKCDIQTNSSMQNSTMVFILFVWDWKHPFWTNLAPKNQNRQFKLKFWTSANSNMENAMVLFNGGAFLF